MFQFDTLGQKIVDELSLLIQEQVILTDRRGFIQASTDVSRINQFHEGALLGIRQQQILHMTDAEVKKLRGVRKGVVLPIIIDGKAIGVLGITGKPEMIQPQALLILRVVELFIQDVLKRKEQGEKVRELELFVFDWLTSTIQDERFIERAVILGIEVELYKQVAVIEATKTRNRFSIQDVDHLLALQYVHPFAKMIRWGQGKVLVLLPEMNQGKLRIELEHLLLHIKRKMKMDVAIGVGEFAHYSNLMTSFNQAERAIKVSKKYGKVLFEHELRFDLISESVPKDTKSKFIQRTVAPLKEETELLHNLRVWFDENQSMQNTAQKLHIHKNTLSYRLQKVERLTGLSVSKIKDVVLLYLGLQFIDESTSE